MSTPFARTLHSIKAENDAVLTQLYLCVGIFIVVGLAIYSIFFSSMLVTSDNYSLSREVTYQENSSSGHPIVHNYISAIFGKGDAGRVTEGGTALFEIEDPSNRNVQQFRGKILTISGDDKSITIQIDLPQENGLSLDLPANVKGRIIIEGVQRSPFDVFCSKLDLQGILRAVSFY